MMNILDGMQLKYDGRPPKPIGVRYILPSSSKLRNRELPIDEPALAGLKTMSSHPWRNVSKILDLVDILEDLYDLLEVGWRSTRRGGTQSEGRWGKRNPKKVALGTNTSQGHKALLGLDPIDGSHVVLWEARNSDCNSSHEERCQWYVGGVNNLVNKS